jgi:hypothetical protein
MSHQTHRHRPNRGPYRRDLRRLPQELGQDGQLCSLLILLLSARNFSRHKTRLGCRLSAGDVEWALARALSAAPLLGGVSRFPAVHGTLCETLELCDRPGRGRTMGVGQATHLQLINRYRCRRDLRRLPQGSGNPRAAFALDFASKCAIFQTPQVATWVQAERRRRGVG